MDFLKGFEKRMKSVGRYAVLMGNSIQKTTWKQYGIENADEQVNMIFTVLMYIMEYSLKEEDCTIDDIAGFIGEINDVFYKRELGYNEYKGLADFIVNKILANDGVSMNFKGYSYDDREYKNINIAYIANKVVYQENGVRRISYYLTEDGYNMMLSTMELENNLKLTVHEMLFKLHLEKADYNRAVNDIKNVFDRLRIQNQKIQEAMHRIMQNALSYTVEEYRQIVEENISTIERTRGEFNVHKEVVEGKIKEFEEQQMQNLQFDSKEKENLENLKIIIGYLNKAIDEHQKILNEHFDLKNLYSKELENYAGMTMVQRFDFRSEIYDRILHNAGLLEHFPEIFNPLFFRGTEKIYNPGKALEYQRKLKKSLSEDDEEELGFDSEEFMEEKRRKTEEKLKKYRGSLSLLIEILSEKRRITLRELAETSDDAQLKRLIPTAEIFREIMIELLTAEETDVEVLRKEKGNYFYDVPEKFQLNEMLLQIIDGEQIKNIHKIYAAPAAENDTAVFENVTDEQGNPRRLKCANIVMHCE